ncbi:MAG: hypothetical protein AAGJ35_15695, partial [Myxococcota bacterium]
TQQPRYQECERLFENETMIGFKMFDQDVGRMFLRRVLKRKWHTLPILALWNQRTKVLARLQHPNIPMFHGANVDAEGRCFWAGEYIEGESLVEILSKLQERRPLYTSFFTHTVRLRVFWQLIQVVAFAHNQGVAEIALDLNALVFTQQGQLKVLGWEHAQIAESSLFSEQPLTFEQLRNFWGQDWSATKEAEQVRRWLPEQSHASEIMRAEDQKRLWKVFRAWVLGDLSASPSAVGASKLSFVWPPHIISSSIFREWKRTQDNPFSTLDEMLETLQGFFER